MKHFTVKRAPMYVSSVAKLSFGAVAFEDINEVTVEKVSVSVSTVRKPCLIDMNKCTL
jgi:hypothetical protein